MTDDMFFLAARRRALDPANFARLDELKAQQRAKDLADALTIRPTTRDAIRIATRVARDVFAQRGNHAEAHLSETELAGICALAIERSKGEQ